MGRREAFTVISDPEGSQSQTEILPNTKSNGIYISRVTIFVYILFSVALAAVVGCIVHFTQPSCGECNAMSLPPITTQSPEALWEECVNMSWARNECLPGTPPCPDDVTISSPPPTSEPENKEDYLLPKDLLPHHYDIELQPDIYQSDPRDFAFNGTSTMHFECLNQTNLIVLHIRLLTIDNSSIVVSDQDGASILVVRTQWKQRYDFYEIELEENLEAGKNYTVTTHFNGPLARDMTGMYWSSYKENNTTKYMIATQFEAPDARKAFPCMDEPALKATFSVSLWHKADMAALSNMPRNHSIPGEDGWTLVVFEKTPIVMPTYLLAFAISNYSYVETSADGGLSEKYSRYWARPEYIDRGFADFVSSNYSDLVFDYFEEYFDHVYDLPKQDQIAIPDFAAGAMENWGLITYREERLLWDPEMSTLYEKQRAAGTIAHELLHQWLGNVVTCGWWSDIWLQEGMARVHQHMAMTVVEPTWHSEELFQAQVLYRAFSVDQMGSAHPVHNPTISVYRNPDSVFTAISYDKAGSFIQMIAEDVLGLEAYKASMQTYVKDMAYKAADYDDLFRAWQKQADMEGIHPGINLFEVCYTWIMQSGYPVITVQKTGPSQISLTQKLFLIEPLRPLQEWYKSEYGYQWNVPITYTTSQDLNTSKLIWMNHTEEHKVEDIGKNLTDSDWVLANVRHKGFYRVNYDEANWNVLIDQLNTDHLVFDVNNRGQFLLDSFALNRAGLLQVPIALNASNYLRNEREYLPWYAFQQGWPYISTIFNTHSSFTLFRKYIQNLTSEVYTDLGWVEVDEDELPRIYLRTLVLSLACAHGHSTCMEVAVNKFADWMQNPDDLLTIIPPDVRDAVYCTAIEAGSTAEWDFLMEQYHESFSHFSTERQRMAGALACSSETWILSKLLSLATSMDESLHLSDISRILASIARSPYGHNVAWDYLNVYWDDIIYTHRMTLMEALVEKFSTDYDLRKLEELFEAHPPTSEESWYESLHITVKANIAWREANEEAILDWLSAYN